MKCYKCEKDIDPLGGYVHTDEDRNIFDERFCWQCLLNHVEKYYGQCPISKHLRKRYNYKIEEQQAELF